MAKKASPERTSSWDLAAFEDNPFWKNTSSGKKKKKPQRVQDLALFSLDSSVHSVEPNEEKQSDTWPFESSPCRMFGGKNTRGSATEGSDERDNTNEALFDKDFADHAKPEKFIGGSNDDDDEDEETSIEDENATDEDDDDIDEDETVDTDGNSFYGGQSTDGSRSSETRQSTKTKQQPPSLLTTTNNNHQNNHSRQRTSVPVSDDDIDDEDGDEGDLDPDAALPSPPTRSASSSATKPRKTERSKSSPSKKKGRPRQLSSASKKSEGSAGSGSNLKSEKRRKSPGSSKSVSGEMRPSRKKSGSRIRPNGDLGSTSYHGGSPPVRSMTTGARRRGISRAKSSDGMEGMLQGGRSGGASTARKGRKRHDDSLSAASAHTSSSVRHSSMNRRSGRSKSKERNLAVNSGLDRRGTLTRAMSTTNVKMPDQYGDAVGPGSVQGGRRSDFKRRSSSSRSLVRDSRDREKSSSRGRGTVEGGASTQQQQPTSQEESTGDAAKARPRLRRKSSARLSRTGSNRSMSSAASDGKKSSSKQHHHADDVSVEASGEGDEATIPSPMSTKSKSKSSRRSSSRDRRDLMVLLRERKTIQPSDLMDKENRRLLHFLMYEHKMGISQKELIRRIREEKESS